MRTPKPSREDIAHDLYEVERALHTALRRLARAVAAPCSRRSTAGSGQKEGRRPWGKGAGRRRHRAADPDMNVTSSPGGGYLVVRTIARTSQDTSDQQFSGWHASDDVQLTNRVVTAHLERERGRAEVRSSTAVAHKAGRRAGHTRRPCRIRRMTEVAAVVPQRTMGLSVHLDLHRIGLLGEIQAA